MAAMKSHEEISMAIDEVAAGLLVTGTLTELHVVDCIEQTSPTLAGEYWREAAVTAPRHVG